MSDRIRIRYRFGVGAAFAASAVVSLLPSYFVGELFTADPYTGFHRYMPFWFSVLYGSLLAPAAFMWGSILALRFARFDWRNSKDIFARFFGIGVGVMALALVTTALAAWLLLLAKFHLQEPLAYQVSQSMGHKGPGLEELTMMIGMWIVFSYGFPFLLAGACGTVIGNLSRQYWIESEI